MAKDPLQILLEKKLGIHVPDEEPEDTTSPTPVALNNDAALAAIALGHGSSIAGVLRNGLNNTQEN
ncbi:hypothetical protein [Pseudarthrobacter siccitolerans]